MHSQDVLDAGRQFRCNGRFGSVWVPGGKGVAGCRVIGWGFAHWVLRAGKSARAVRAHRPRVVVSLGGSRWKLRAFGVGDLLLALRHEERAGAVEDHVFVDDALAHPLHGGDLVHHLEQHLLDGGAQAAGAGLALDGSGFSRWTLSHTLELPSALVSDTAVRTADDAGQDEDVSDERQRGNPPTRGRTPGRGRR